jgi:glucose dehydrogenase/mono/diheme cytochrome c family protein
MRGPAIAACAVLCAAIVLPIGARQRSAREGDWPWYGRDPGAQRFSPLTQITPENVHTLQRVWTFDTGATAMQVTPLVIDGIMYVAAGTHIFALEPERGKVIWRFAYDGMSRRGLAYWPGDARTGPRFYTGAGDGQMIAVDVRTGQLAPGFGASGVVDLKASVSVDGGAGAFGLPSPPAVYRDVVITGGTNGEGAPGTGRLYGDVRGWDARTGTLLWTFHTVPRPGEPGYETWPAGAYKNRSGTNAWGFMTVDVERGLVYVPLGSPTDDFYGADRHGNNLYGNSLVALDALTGKLVWFQQLVHHDLWDYDPAAPPTLLDVRRQGRTIPAVAQITKTGLLFIFDRVTGEPIFGIEERPVPQTNVPGEWTSKTQPFPVKPAPLSRMTFDPLRDFYTLTPAHEAWCRNLWEQNGLFAAGPYAPMPLGRDVVTFPSTLGGGGFGGLSYNPHLGLVFVNVSNLGMVGRMEPRTDPKTGKVTYVKNSVTGGPYGRFWNPDNRIPCSAPPFGELVAVNVNTGDVAWRVPLGIVEELAAKGFENTGALTLGGSMATASGLVFIGATADKRFRAFDATTGKELWVAELDADAKAAPMTFLGRDGRQYVVIMAGGGHQLSRTKPASGSNLIAFALGARTTTNERPAISGSGGERAPVPPAPSASAAGMALPRGDGQALVERVCSGCHDPSLVMFTRADEEGWAVIVNDMAARGAQATRNELDAITAYLAANFNRDSAFAPLQGVAPAAGSDDGQQLFAAGEAIYRTLCVACHQADGRGRDKVAPPLVGSALTLGPPAIAVRIMLHGKRGPTNVMPALGGLMTDAQIAAVLTYVRRDWGQAGSAIAAATVREIRKETAGRARPWTEEELRRFGQGAHD